MTLFASWGIILDDVIFPDGRSAMGRPGGGGLYAVSGMRLWQEHVVIYAAVGPDFDASSLQEIGLDGRGLIVNERPTPRAWQLFEHDGTRTQIPRVTRGDWNAQLVEIVQAEPVDPDIRWAHFLGRGSEIELPRVRQLHAAGILLSAEPIVGEDITPAELGIIQECLAYFTIFSPGESELRHLVGDRPVQDQLRELAQFGPRFINLRQGAKGSLVYDSEVDQFWQVPAAPAQVVDVTGAGNAYCGGFLTGWVSSGSLVQAAAQASVSAAMTIEQIGPRPLRPETMAEAQARAQAIQPLIQPLV